MYSFFEGVKVEGQAGNNAMVEGRKSNPSTALPAATQVCVCISFVRNRFARRIVPAGKQHQHHNHTHIHVHTHVHTQTHIDTHTLQNTRLQAQQLLQALHKQHQHYNHHLPPNLQPQSSNASSMKTPSHSRTHSASHPPYANDAHSTPMGNTQQSARGAKPLSPLASAAAKQQQVCVSCTCVLCVWLYV